MTISCVQYNCSMPSFLAYLFGFLIAPILAACSKWDMHSVTNHCDFNSKNPFLLLNLLQITWVCETHVPRSSWKYTNFTGGNLEYGYWKLKTKCKPKWCGCRFVSSVNTLKFRVFRICVIFYVTHNNSKKLAVFVCLCKLDLTTRWVHVREGCCFVVCV
jgi:hypothetical protein